MMGNLRKLFIPVSAVVTIALILLYCRIDNIEIDPIYKMNILQFDLLPYELLKFQVRLNKTRFHKTLVLASVLMKQLDKHKIIYMAAGGTLLGIYRHHGIIPWDDDIDFYIHAKQKDLTIKALAELNETHKLFYWKNIPSFLQFHKLDGEEIKSEVKHGIKFPFIDILISVDYPGNKYQDEFFKGEIWSKEKVYPLVKRYYNGLLINTPCDIEFTIKELFHGSQTCKSTHLDHINIKGVPPSERQTVPCEKLKEYYAFVERNQEKVKNITIITETLKFKSKVIHTVKYSVPNFCTDQMSVYPSDLIVL